MPAGCTSSMAIWGSMPAAMTASWACAGLRTLAVRLARHQETGAELWPAGCRPGRRSPASSILPCRAIRAMRLWKRDFSGACGLFGVVLKPVSEAACGRFRGRVAAISGSAIPGAGLKA